MDYTIIITRSDFVEKLQKRGYDFTNASVIDITHFESQNDAIDDFLQNVFDMIHELIVFNRGHEWAKAFFEDMQQTDLEGEALDYKNMLIDALVQQAIYIYDNGDSQASSDKEEKRQPYSEKAMQKLWGRILRG